MAEAEGRPPDDAAGARARRPRGGLGRGLGALIAPPASDESRSLNVPVDAIEPNPRQPRYAIDPEALAELTESVKTYGVLQPLVVTRGADGRYTLIAGERRWRAARAAGLSRIPVIVKEASQREQLELALVENIQRADLNPLETALAYRTLADEHGLTQEAIAKRVGKSRVAVANSLRLLSLPDSVRNALAEGVLTEGHARAILLAEDPLARPALAREVAERGLSVRQTEDLARRMNEARAASSASDEDAPPAAPARRQQDADIVALEQRLRETLGTKVQVVHGRRGGRIVIHYFSDDELQGLFEAICGDG